MKKYVPVKSRIAYNIATLKPDSVVLFSCCASKHFRVYLPRIGCPRIIRTFYFDVLKEGQSNFIFRLHSAAWSTLTSNVVAHSVRQILFSKSPRNRKKCKVPPGWLNCEFSAVYDNSLLIKLLCMLCIPIFS